MKYFFLLAVLLLSISFYDINASQTPDNLLILFLLPSKEKFQEKCTELGCDDFVNKTNLAQELSNKLKIINDICVAIQTASMKHLPATLDADEIAFLSRREKINNVYRAVLQDYPEKLAEIMALKNCGNSFEQIKNIRNATVENNQ